MACPTTGSPTGRWADVNAPEVRYATAPDGTSIAYQVTGHGPVDLVLSPGLWSNLEVMWELPEWSHFLERLAGFSRLTVFDMRGVGLSDRGPVRPTIELQRDDIGAVLDAAGIQSGVVFGNGRGASMAMLFAATHPERTRALVLYSPIAKSIATPDFPHSASSESMGAFVESVLRHLGTGKNLQVYAPSLASDARITKWWGRLERLTASPGALRELAEILIEIDVRSWLPAIHVPTLVLHREHEAIIFTAQSRDVAERIEGAVYVELPGEDFLFFLGDSDAVADEIEEFVTGVRPARQANRVLATLLFTDIVDSTGKQSELGDHVWKDLLERHHAVVRDLVARYRGEEQDTAGDGFYVRFDGPGRAIACARAIAESVRGLGMEVRLGIHAGECEIVDGKCSGLSVTTGARVMAHAGPSEVLVTQTVKDLTAGSDLVFDDAGEHELKGIQGRWRLYRVVE